MSEMRAQPFPVLRVSSLVATTKDTPLGDAEDVGAGVGFPNQLSEFVYTRTYSRWRDDLGRRERWDETVGRYIEFLAAERKLPQHVLEEIRVAILSMDVLPSMRALWSAGEAARRDNTTMYNCSFVPLDSLRSFSELLYILMMGTGVGFSVENQFVSNLPKVAPISGQTIPHVIPDSTVGWAEAFYFGLQQWFSGHKVAFDYSLIRPAGAPLKTKGGRASGPDPLVRLFEFAERTILAAAGRKLQSVEAHDIGCMVGEIVMAGGVRRAALISISDVDDEAMRHAKDFSRGEFPTLRYMANNSAFYAGKPDAATFQKEWAALVNSGSGERGLSIDSWHRRANRPQGMVRTNPCGEIGLRFSRSTDPITGEGGSGQFCNLSAAVMRAHDTVETFSQKVRLATWIGAIQSSFTNFPFLRPGWQQVCDEDRLLGVDITGQCDAPHLSTSVEAMKHFNRVAIETAAEAAAYLGINMPVAITCGKPSGNSSQLVDCSSGFHARYAKFYIRRVRISNKDPLFRLIREQGVPVHKDNQFADWKDEDCPTWVAEFPVAAPKGAILRDAETAVGMLERYKQVVQSWLGERGHNQSATIYVKDTEWDEVGRWLFENFEDVTGISFLPYDGGNYKLAPYEEIDEATYNDWVSWFPNIDFSVLTQFEQEDRGEGATELACSGGSCTIDYEAMAMQAGLIPEEAASLPASAVPEAK